MVTPRNRIRVVKGPTKRVHDLLHKKLVAFNHAKGSDSKWKPLVLEVCGPRGEFLGGLAGGTLWGWLYIELLWLDEVVRGSGLGRNLIGQAEAIAKTRGCRNVFLSTFSFQAPSFYRKLGYRSFGRLANFPKGHSRSWLAKSL
jgi:ribosomal protein S18 acetylase RimI-like enzyme